MSFWQTNGIIFWRLGPFWYRLPPLGECSRNPSVSVYQLALLREAAFGFSEFLLKTLSVHLPISWCVIQKHTWPHCNECSAVFDQKRHGPHSPPSLFTLSCPERLFFVCFPRWKKSSKGNVLPMMKRWNRNKQTNKGRSTKQHQNRQVQKLFWAVEKHVNRCIASNGEYFEGD